jgi:hypothetical protein
MTSPDSDIATFSRLIEALRPWLGQIIFIGGRAHRLYRERPEAVSVTYDALQTDDADVALNPRTMGASASIRVRLKEFGFEEELSGDERPPVTHYGLGQKDAGFYAEFLTPLLGGENRRDGSPDVTERVAGVIAQKLRYLDVLLIAPWSVTVQRETGFDLSESATILIPNPASYLVQKLLIHDLRKPGDQAKDALYIHDTIELFSGSLPALRTLWRESVMPTLHPRAIRKVRAQADALFGSVGDTVRTAALIAAPRRMTPASIQTVCKAGLDEVLGTD